MNIDERCKRLEAATFGNGKKGVLERIGRLEVMTTIIIGLQVPILLLLLKIVFSK